MKKKIISILDRYIDDKDISGASVLIYKDGKEYLRKVSGMKFSLFLEKELFSPLDMKDTAFYVAPEKQNRLARSYVPSSHAGNLAENEQPVSDDDIHEYLGSYLGVKSRMKTPNAFESGGAGLASTLEDYMKFALMLLNGGSTPSGIRLLSPETVSFMTQRLSSERTKKAFLEAFDLKGFCYSNLLRIGSDPGLCDTLMSPGEYGWDGWLGPYFANFPQKKATLLIAIQRTNSGTYSLTRRIRNVVLSEI